MFVCLGFPSHLSYNVASSSPLLKAWKQNFQRTLSQLFPPSACLCEGLLLKSLICAVIFHWSRLAYRTNQKTDSGDVSRRIEPHSPHSFLIKYISAFFLLFQRHPCFGVFLKGSVSSWGLLNGCVCVRPSFSGIHDVCWEWSSWPATSWLGWVHVSFCQFSSFTSCKLSEDAFRHDAENYKMDTI